MKSMGSIMGDIRIAAQIKEAAVLFEEAQSKLNYDDYDNAVVLLQRAVTLNPSVSFPIPLLTWR